MLEAAIAFVVYPTNMLTLWGGVGNAKTLILQAVVNECLQNGYEAVYITMHDLLNYIREAYDERKSTGEMGSAWSRLNRFGRVKVLAIDEADKVKASEWAIEYETALIDRRYRLGLSHLAGTLFALNADPADPNVLPEWIFDRLNDGRNTIIHNGDPSMRRLMR